MPANMRPMSDVWVAQVWAEFETLINLATERKFGFVGEIIASRDALFPPGSDQPIYCVSLGHEELPAGGFATCEGEGWHPYCTECLDILDGSEEVRRGLSWYRTFQAIKEAKDNA